MGKRVTASLHELVYLMDAYADRLLAADLPRRPVGRDGAMRLDQNLLAFLTPLAGPLGRDGLDVTGLAKALHVSKAAVSKRLPALERDGWVVTAADPGHRQRVLITLTDEASALVNAAGDLLSGRFGEVLARADIDPEAFHAHLRTLIHAVRDLNGDDPR